MLPINNQPQVILGVLPEERQQPDDDIFELAMNVFGIQLLMDDFGRRPELQRNQES